MIFKKYVADTMNEALKMIKLEMGPEAVIVSKRSVRPPGLLGMFQPKKIEVTAAVDEVREKEPPKPPAVIREQKGETDQTEVEKELNEVKEMLQKLVEEKKVKKTGRLGIRRLMLERDVGEEVVNSIVRGLKEKQNGKRRLQDSEIMDGIRELINANPVMEGRIHAFIGPTGVGKTTTIAKLAALRALNTREKVGLVTIDTYRIGAVEQLKIYADILGLPFEVINSTNDIEKIFENLKDCDVIFVDTTGRSIKNIMQLSELKLYLDRIKPDTVHLVVSMTTKYNDLLQILKGFGTMDYNSIILTKFDETATYGSIINIAFNTKAPISYITMGQNVPDDIEEADRERLLDFAIGEGGI